MASDLHDDLCPQAHGHAASADLGGSVITGIDGNPLAVLASQMGIGLYHIQGEPRMYLPDGSVVDEELDQKVQPFTSLDDS
jgi:lysine-specific histone demethylase 1